jgi:hypothetical protein
MLIDIRAIIVNGERLYMKKIIFIFFLILTVKSFGQVYDSPIDSTLHYHLRLYAQSARSSATVLNQDKVTLDSVIYSLIVYTDTKQTIIRNDTLIISDTASGSHSFTTTATSDSVAIAGMDSLDVIILTRCGTTYNVNDVLSVDEHTGYFKVYRNSSGTSGLKYNYLWIRKYQ